MIKSTKAIRNLYDKLAGPEYDQASNPYFVFRRAELHGEHATGKILEIGAGTGLVTRELSQRGWVVALDLSGNMLRALKAKYPDVPMVVADAHHLPFRPRSFDSVALAETIYYFHDPLQVIQQAVGMMVGGGVMSVSSFSGRWRFLQKSRILLDRLGIKIGVCDAYPVGMSRWQLAELFKAAGLTITRLQGFMFIPSFKWERLNRWLEQTMLQRVALSQFIVGVK